LGIFYREWYGYHFPELIRIIPDNYTYARAVHLIKNRKEFSNEQEEELEAITMDSGKTAAVFEAMKTTIGLLNLFFILIINNKLFFQEWIFHQLILLISNHLLVELFIYLNIEKVYKK
jgi:hypothetical protein